MIVAPARSCSSMPSSIGTAHGIRRYLSLTRTGGEVSSAFSKSAYRSLLSELMARFNAVAAANSYAMFGGVMTAVEIGEESGKNRLMGDPHLKSMVAKDGVNQALALVLTRWETAQALGVAERAIFLHGSRDGHRAPVLNRRSIGQSEAMDGGLS